MVSLPIYPELPLDRPLSGSSGRILRLEGALVLLGRVQRYKGYKASPCANYAVIFALPPNRRASAVLWRPSLSCGTGAALRSPIGGRPRACTQERGGRSGTPSCGFPEMPVAAATRSARWRQPLRARQLDLVCPAAPSGPQDSSTHGHPLPRRRWLPPLIAASPHLTSSFPPRGYLGNSFIPR